MLLLAAVVQIEDAPALNDKLVERGFRLTKIDSTGGLFGTDSVALLLGVENDQLDQVVEAIVATCKTRNVHMSSVAMLDPTFLYLTPMEVEVGGAVVFCVPVERFFHLPAKGIEREPTATEQNVADQPLRHAPLAGDSEVLTMSEAQSDSSEVKTPNGKEISKLIVAIVKGDDADDVIRTLLTAGHRLTRINTTGGFLRRGNATLLIGVNDAQVDEIVNLIESACPRRTEPAPLEKGLPEYSANVFVLDTSYFIRI